MCTTNARDTSSARCMWSSRFLANTCRILPASMKCLHMLLAHVSLPQQMFRILQASVELPASKRRSYFQHRSARPTKTCQYVYTVPINAIIVVQYFQHVLCALLTCSSYLSSILPVRAHHAPGIVYAQPSSSMCLPVSSR